MDDDGGALVPKSPTIAASVEQLEGCTGWLVRRGTRWCTHEGERTTDLAGSEVKATKAFDRWQNRSSSDALVPSRRQGRTSTSCNINGGNNEA